MNYTRNPNREFNAETRNQERIAANKACRICGKKENLEWLQCAHIYTLSINQKWERAGGDAKKWYNDNYVKSIDNCVLLCKTHHTRIDSKLGLQKVDVEYLESLKTDVNHCTALIGHAKGHWRRCQKKNGRGNSRAKGNGYRCGIHLSGGYEESLVERGETGLLNKILTTKKSPRCVVM